MTPSTVGNYLLQESLPPDVWDGSPLDKKTQNKVFQQLAEKHPDKYVDTLQSYQDNAADTVTRYGGIASISMADLRIPPKVKEYRDKLSADIDKIAQDPYLDIKTKNSKIVDLTRSKMEEIQKLTVDEAIKQGSGLALSAQKGFRSNPMQITQLMFGDTVLADHKNRPVPIVGLHGYNEGVTPAEYWAGSYGARAGHFSVQFNTANAGFLAKQLKYAASRQVITGDDCGAVDSGIKVKGDDPENIGAVLAQSINGIPAGTAITKDHLQLMEGRDIRVRSLTTCQQPDGVCKKCAGKREQGHFPAMGDYVGLNSASTVSEPLTQCILEDTLVRMADYSTKHIQDIVVGDMVLGSDKNGMVFPVRVSNTFDHGYSDVWETTFKAREVGVTASLKSTLAHKILMQYTLQNPYRMSELLVEPVGNKHSTLQAVSIKGSIDSAEYVAEPDAYILGCLIGNVGVSPGVHQIAMAMADTDMLQHMSDYCEERGLSVSHNDRCKYMINKPEHMHEHPLKPKLRTYGILDKYSYEKRFPIGWQNWDMPTIIELLSGLIDTDGSIVSRAKKYSIQYCSTSKALVEDIQQLLAYRFGILTGKCHSNENKRGYTKSSDVDRPLYSVHVDKANDIVQLCEVLNLHHGRKKMLCQDVLDNAKYCRDGKSNFYLQKRTPIGQGHVYDIEVDHQDHLFVLANGLIVSNSLSLSAKHLGGVSSKAKAVTGLQEVAQYFNLPKNFEGAATLAPEDGQVSNVIKAAQGGHYIFVGDYKLYTPEDRNPTVHRGDIVEAGDAISEGIPHPGEVASYKGLGAGRSYWMKAFDAVLKENGVNAKRRHIDSVARAMFDRVVITNPEGFKGHAMGEVVPYSFLTRGYTPRVGSEEMLPSLSLNHYLEKPVLDYTIGTRITPSVMKELKDAGIKTVKVNKDKPDFEPEIIRIMDIPATDPDWKVRLSGFGLRKSLMRGATEGADSDSNGTSYVPRLADATLMR